MLESSYSISKAHLAAGRAIDQLRRQLGIILQDDNGEYLGAIPAEGITAELFGALMNLPDVQACLLLTSARAHYLGLADTNITVDAKNLSFDALTTLADPLTCTTLPALTLTPTTPSQDRLLDMAKYASLLPAMLVVKSTTLPDDWLLVSQEDVAQYWDHPPLDIVSLVTTKLPIKEAEDVVIHCFRTRYGTSTHLALTFDDISKDNAPLTRIHSSCITGDILGSLRCDCGDQLHMAISQLRAAPSGILLYLHQEGRGIGIANKLRAYQLQERGLDTYDANLALGYGEDERDFTIAGGILKKLGVAKIKLLTNNPKKVDAIGKTGIDVVERIALIAPQGKHNHAYLDAKAKKSGHLF
jgi:GTP cyclohydrolase II